MATDRNALTAGSPPAPKAPIFLLRLFLAYTVGNGLATLLWLLPALVTEPKAFLYNLSFAAIITLVAFMVSYKYFIVAVIIGFVFRLSIWRYMLLWAAAAPFAVAALYSLEGYFFESGEKNFVTYLSSEGSNALLAFFYTVVYGGIFYAWNRLMHPRSSGAEAFSQPPADPSAQA